MQALESSDTDEESAVAMKRLRPRASTKFRDLISKEDHKRELQLYGKKNYSPIMMIKQTFDIE